MAKPDIQSTNFRYKVNGLVEHLRDINSVLAIVEDFGATDQERAAFFNDAFGDGTENADLTWAEFATGIQALRDVRASWEAGKIDIAPLLK